VTDVLTSTQASRVGAVLGIDTAAPVVGAALWLPSGLGPCWRQRVVRGADAVLLPAITSLLATLSVPLVRVAVAVGPGAFTGLRVGVATALGIAEARGIPVAPVGSLAARAALLDDHPRVLAVLDARKGRVYAGLFVVKDGIAQPQGPEADALLSSMMPPSPFVAVGEGAARFVDEIRAAGGSIAADATGSAALSVARIGAAVAAMDPAELALRYLRDADAVPPASLGQRVGRPSSLHKPGPRVT